MASESDKELKNAFAKLHVKVIDTREKISWSDLQIENLHRSKQISELTQVELKNLPKNTKTYDSVGRMFVLQDIDTIKADLDKRTKLADEKIKSHENNKTFLLRNLKESEDNIREMVQKRQNQESS